MFIQLSETDFEELWQTSAQWKARRKNWHDQQEAAGRFEVEPGEILLFNFRRAYWFDNAANRILAQNFLIANGYKFTKVWDSENPSWGFMLLTNYERSPKGETWS